MRAPAINLARPCNCKRYRLTDSELCPALAREQPLASRLDLCKLGLPGANRAALATPPRCSRSRLSGGPASIYSWLSGGKWRHFSGVRQLSAHTHGA